MSEEQVMIGATIFYAIIGGVLFYLNMLTKESAYKSDEVFKDFLKDLEDINK